MDARETGLRGEELAARYLLERGYTVLHRNWRCPPWELDLVARRGGVLHVVEVKSRRSRSLTAPEEAMTPAKCEAVYRAACRYVEAFGLDVDTQFDLIAVEFDAAGGHRLRYLPNVFTPRW